MTSQDNVRSNQLTRGAVILFVALFTVFVYTFLHEAGHALVGLGFGQTLTRFNVNFFNLDAHVRMAGVLTPAQSALKSAAGTALPLLAWFIFMGIVPRKSNFGLEILKLFSAMAFINSLLSWIVLPVIYLAGYAPTDDVTSFLEFSQFSPLLVSAVALGFYLAGWLVFLAKIDGIRNQVLLIRAGSSAKTAGVRKTLLVMGGLALALAALTVAANNLAGASGAARFFSTQDYASVAEIDLSERAYASEGVAQFNLQQTGRVSVLVVIRDLDAQVLALTIGGPGGFSETILSGEGIRADHYQDRWEKTLPAGEYHLALRSSQSPGILTLFLQTP